MEMNVFSTVRDELKRLEPGSIITYKDFDVPATAVPTLIKALSAFYKQGILGKITKGMYYKPRPTEFGTLPPSTTQLLGLLLERQKDQVAYLTGINTYNALRLTTQLSTEYVIATDRPRSPIKLGGGTIRFVLARLPVAPSSPRLAQLLDAIADIRAIPDCSPTRAAQILAEHLRNLSPEERKDLASLSTAYPPSARAVLGILLDQIGERRLAQEVFQGLNPLSTYRTGLDMSVFPSSLPRNIA